MCGLVCVCVCVTQLSYKRITSIYGKYASCRWLRTQDSNLRADVVLSMSRDPPGQWFPETEYVSVRHLCGNKWHTAQNNLLEFKVLYAPRRLIKYCALTWRQNCVTVDCVVVNECKCIFLAWELVRTFFAFLVGTRWNFSAVLCVEQQVRSV